MQITIKNKKYKAGKITRDKYKQYTAVRERLMNKDFYSDEDIDDMINTIVSVYDNKFTFEDVEKELDISDIILNFTMVDVEIAEKMNNKIEKIKKQVLSQKKNM